MSFTNRIEHFDADHGIPRRADEVYLPAYYAFLRCAQDAVQIFVFILLGALSALCLWGTASYFQVGFLARLIYVVFIVFALGIALAEATQVLWPYHRFNQLLTYGTANWATPLHLEGAGFAHPGSEPLKLGELQLGTLPRPLRRAYRFVLPPQTVLGSLVFFGPPGAGKSVLLMNYLKAWAGNGSAIILDPKGELYEYCARYFRKVRRLDFQNPEYSDRWNFILQCKGRKEYAHMMASIMLGLEGTKHTSADPFWGEAELALLTAILLYLPTIVDHPTPAMVHEFIALRSFEDLCAELEGSDNYDVRVQWGTFNKAPEATRGSVFTGLAAKINPFTIDAAQAISATILKREQQAGARYIDFNRLREPGVAIFVVIPEGAASRYKIPLMTFLGQAVETLRESIVKEDTTPVLFVCDEAANIPIVNLKEIAGVGRGRRFSVALFYQNLSQGYDQYGEHGFNSILGSITTKTFLPGCDDVTTHYATRLVGQTTVWGHTFDDAPGTQYDKTRTTEAARSLIDPAELRQLLKHKQAITIVETMPPVRWTFPPSAKTGPRVIPREYGRPRIISFLDAEQRTSERRLNAQALAQPGVSEVAAGAEGET
ncbi:MAG: type IV secretory system conjugative DNA transfer family protein, partial [Acidobacteria bacterium]|nr:type IV secretory system conjugative DNA transfer family protein [Acidobacteriota bacterium]